MINIAHGRQTCKTCKMDRLSRTTHPRIALVFGLYDVRKADEA